MREIINLEDHRKPTPTIKNRKVTPTPPKYSDLREREYLTPKEVELVTKAAKKVGRHGHRDMTMVMIGDLSPELVPFIR
ncbi:hypothetical protein MHM93_01045 [Pseudoalteromonas sp. MM17-2]|uniref:hypothetical protein n=1 Tax=Pseudoalteromonas sp. MM17-2 TaxID=2917753 RepID=UPI001EF612D2|nr:hypothetical protein [Pseudoalteromonas sp. MM17-2]MCG7542766.1 hypothetical protein [Pseudoalteromonas sp. MM17-2]